MAAPASYDQQVLRTLRPWLAPLVLALVVLTSCGESAHPSAPPQGIAQARTGPSAHLLSTGQMPTAGADWSSVDTVANDVEVVGPCHLTSLVDIGALSAVRRTWSTDGGAVPRAVQVVARFADNKSAWRAHQVLAAWQADCGERTDDAVGPLREVPVSTGMGQAYRVAGKVQATDLGIVRKGAYLSVVALVGAASDVPADSAVAKAAVKKIAATF